MRSTLEISMIGAGSVSLILDGVVIHSEKNVKLLLLYWDKQVII